MVLGDVDAAGMVVTQSLIEETTPGARTLAVEVDVRDGEAVDTFADDAFGGFGQVDVLCNNAGVFVGGYLWERPPIDIEFVLDVNVHGILNGIRSFVPRMIAQDTEGHIVNTSSVAGLFGSPFAGPYNISKFAAFAAGEALANDLIAADTKLRARVLCPGIIKTDIATRACDRDPFPGTERSDDQAFVNQLLADMVDVGLDPMFVAGRVVEAIRVEQFLIITHDHHADYILQRAAALSRRELPPIVDLS